VTWANDNHFDFVQNWVWHLRGLNVTNFLVGAMDDVILHKLIEARVPTFNMKTGLDTKDLGWGTAAFHKMGRTKVSLIQSVRTLHARCSMGMRPCAAIVMRYAIPPL